MERTATGGAVRELSSRSADRKARRTPSRVPAASYSARCLRLATAETRQSSSRRQQKLEKPPARFVFSQETFPVRRPEPLLSKARSAISAAWINSTAAPVGRASQHREVHDEGDRGDGSGCGNGRDEAGGAARAAGGGASNYGDVVVQVHASGFTGDELSWPSTWVDRLGRDRTPSIPGHELAGVVTALSYGTTGLSVGQRVFGLTDWVRDGTLAEYVAVEARNLAPLPGDVDFTEGAALVMPGLTAWQGLFEHGRLRAGQSVLVHGAAGVVGSMATQLAREAGAYVIGTGRAGGRQTALDFGARSSSTSITTPWKMSAESIWFSMSSAATSRCGPHA